MQEDVTGTQTEAGRRRFATCVECGRVFDRRSARIAESGLEDEAHSEFAELCPECDRLLREGERPVSITE